MQNLSPYEVSEICKIIGEKSPKRLRKIYGGNIHQSWQIEFKSKKFFLKRNLRKKRFLKFEVYSLRNLEKHTNKKDLITPRVIAYLNIQDIEVLLMEWVDMQNGNQRKLGKGLGEMHLNSAEYSPKKFGFPVEGFIGKTVQTQGWENNWIDCFLNLRIKPQLSMLKNNLLEFKTIKKINEKIRSQLINHKPLNALVHGDLWSGNIGVDQSGRGVIFDPASWWADSEVDIAMTQLFGGFKREFYEEYYKIIPKNKGFEKRMIIYNFYHILNHANMFGGSYFYEVQEYVREILKM